MELIILKVALKSTTRINGELFVMISLVSVMPMLFVDNLALGRLLQH